jgi:hypothetical protein
MDERQQQQINQAAEQYANAVMEAQRTMAERGASAQETNAQLTRQFFDGVIDNLRKQVEGSRGTSEELAEQTQKAQEAARALTQEATSAFMGFMDTLFALAKGGTKGAGGK